jgi:hypothetical protein
MEAFHRAQAVATGWVEQGDALVMVAYTMAHERGERLADTRAALVGALGWVRNGRPFRELCARWGISADRFYGNEVTDGGNGWHFHRHEVNRVALPANCETPEGRDAWCEAFKSELHALYREALKRYGRHASLAHGLVVQLVVPSDDAPEKAASYATKFALEATSAVTKVGRGKGRSPWELLDDAADKALPDTRRARARARFREFVTDSHGMHWTWFSEGCRVENPPEKAWADDAGVPVLDLSFWEWRCIRQAGLQVWLLEQVELCGADAAGKRLKRFSDPLRWSKRFRWRDRWLPESPGGELCDESAF